MKKPLITVVLFALALVCTGCKKDTGTVPVTGKIIVNGEPMEDVFVSFSPVGEGEPGSGRTDAQGVYTLKTSQGEMGAGVKPGSYKVSLSKLHGEWDGKSFQDNPGGEPIKKVKTTELIPLQYTTKSK